MPIVLMCINKLIVQHWYSNRKLSMKLYGEGKLA